MIIGEQKPVEEIKRMLGAAERILVLGCGTCVAVCMAGGEKEAAMLATALRMATKLDGQEKEIRDYTVQRQCEFEYNENAAELIDWADLIVSIACGIGVAFTSFWSYLVMAFLFGQIESKAVAPAPVAGDPGAPAPTYGELQTSKLDAATDEVLGGEPPKEG